MEKLFDRLWHYSRTLGSAPAVMDDHGEITWENLLSRIDNICLGLAHQGMRSGRSVGIMVKRDRHLPLSFLAILRGRGVVVPLEPSFGSTALGDIAGAAKPEILIHDADYDDQAGMLCRGHNIRVRVRIGTDNLKNTIPWQELEKTDARGGRFPEARLDTPCCQDWSYNKCAELSGAVLTLRNLMLAVHSASRLFQFTSNDHHFCLLPSGVRPYDHVLRPLMTGGRIIMQESSSIRLASQAIEDYGVTVIQAPPFFYRLFCEWHEAVPGKTSDLRILESCGHTSKWLRKRVNRTLEKDLSPTWKNEFSTGAALAPHPEAFGPPLQNHPAPGILTRILTKDEVPASGDEVGELWLRGGMLSQQQITLAGETHKTLDDAGWLHTGNMARRTIAGEVQVLGLPEESLIRHGHEIILREIELCLEGHRRVREAAAVAIEHTGKSPLLVVVALPDEWEMPTVEHLTTYLERRLPPHQMPDRLLLARRLPRTPMGEIDRSHLRKGLLRQVSS